MRAQLVHRTNRGIQLKGRDGEPVRLDATAMMIIQQRWFRQRLVPLEHNWGMPIRRAKAQ